MQKTDVAFKICKQYNKESVSACLNSAFELIIGGLAEYIKPKMKVLIKPDLYSATQPDLAQTTHPAVVSAVAELVAKCGASCVIADSPYGDFSQAKLDAVYAKTEMLNASNDGNASLNTNTSVYVAENPNGVVTKQLYLIDAINDADVIINVGKFRCDKYLGLIGCTQNLFGLTAGKVKNLIQTKCYTQQKFYNYILDTYALLENKIVLNILDGIVSFETNNTPRILNSLIVSTNPLCVDAVALQIIDQSTDCPLFNIAQDRGLFPEFQIVGDDINSVVLSDYNYCSASTENIKRGSKARLHKAYLNQFKQVTISPAECKGCKKCIAPCPVNAISMQGEHAVVDYTKCINCFKCVDCCPYRVIKTKTPLKYKNIMDNINKKIKN